MSQSPAIPSLPQIHQWSRDFKLLTRFFVVTLSIGVLSGLVMIVISSGVTPTEISESYRGSELSADELADEFAIPEKYPRQLKELLVIFHSHVTIFAIIYAAIGFLFLFNSRIRGKWRMTLILEPFVSIILTFGSLLAIRYIHPGFTWTMIISSTMMYLSYFIMAGIVLWDTYREDSVS